ncbi:MAG: hypothetical protein WD023_10570 [Ilumatobacteraceae bacterium]
MSILASEGGPSRDGGAGAWMFELRGILTVIIGVVVLMGSVYFILSTNMGGRLAFLVSFASLAGWFFLMGAVWWTYGIGLKGPDPSWQPMQGRTVLQDTNALGMAGALDEPLSVAADETPTETAATVAEAFVNEGWKQLDPSAASFGQASSSAEPFLLDSQAFASSSEYKVVNVFDFGGERKPRFADGKIDFIAFWHNPRYSVVEVAPVVPVRAEAGRAPSVPRIDESQPHQYVYMIRDRGGKRHPAAYITIGSLIVFVISCWLLHRRDRLVAYNRSQLALPAKV